MNIDNTRDLNAAQRILIAARNKVLDNRPAWDFLRNASLHLQRRQEEYFRSLLEARP